MEGLERFRRAIHLVWRSSSGWTSASMVVIMIQGVLPLASIYLTKLIVDTVSAAVQSEDGTEYVRTMFFLVALAGLAALAGALCNAASSVIGSEQAEKVTNRFHFILHAKAMEVDLDSFENPEFHDKLHRTQEEAGYRPVQIVNSLAEAARNGIALLTIAGLVFSFHWVMASLLVTSCLPRTLARWKYGRNLHRWHVERTPDHRRAWFLHWMLTEALYAKEVRSYLLGYLFKSRYAKLREKLRIERLRILTHRGLAEFFGSVLSTVTFFVSYAVIAYQTTQGVLTIGDMIMYFQAFQRAQDYFQDLMKNLADLHENHLFLSSFYDLLDLEKKVVDPAEPQSLPGNLKTGIEFNRVGFIYPRGHKKLLHDISLTMEPGKIIALVGENGSGKTTLAKLMCRFYDPTEGFITVDGIDLRRFETCTLWKEVGVLFQDYSKYPMTARENIWLGASYRPVDDGLITAAAVSSGADELIEKMRNGYDTVLSKAFDDGTELSMGEWQKVALARLFYKKSSILILDEPTAFMDSKSEDRFFRNLRESAFGRVILLISHRRDTVRIADHIYVLDNGRIIEHGSYEDLMAAGGKFVSLFRPLN